MNNARTRGRRPQQGLQFRRQANNMVGRPRPKHETVALIAKARLRQRPLQPQDCLVNHQALPSTTTTVTGGGGGEKLCLLLRVALGSVHRVQRLDLSLYFRGFVPQQRASETKDTDKPQQASRKQFTKKKKKIRKNTKDKGGGGREGRTALSWHARISARYGFSPGCSTMPDRSSRRSLASSADVILAHCSDGGGAYG